MAIRRIIVRAASWVIWSATVRASSARKRQCVGSQMKFLAISLPRHLSPWPKKAPTITGRGKLKQSGVRGLNSALPALPTKAEHPLVALPLFGDLLVSAKDLFVEATSPTIQGRLAADPKKAH